MCLFEHAVKPRDTLKEERDLSVSGFQQLTQALHVVGQMKLLVSQLPTLGLPVVGCLTEFNGQVDQ
jgi:hypothetical protein